MLDLNLYTPIVFLIATIAVIIWFLLGLRPALNRTRFLAVLTVIVLWLVIQSNLSLNGFYLDYQANPPRFLLLVLPALISLVLALVFAGKYLAQKLSLKMLTAVHLVRIPVEITLWWLFRAGYVPKLMTFEGGNIDILAGISAAIMLLVAFKPEARPRALIIWNIASLILVFNIIVRAIFSVPNSLQRLAFEQPNIAISYFPFVLLPSVIVPIVLFAHIISLRKLLSD